MEVTTTVKAEDIFLAKGKYGVMVPVKVNGNKEVLRELIANNSNHVYKSGTSGAYEKVDSADDATGTFYLLTNEVNLAENYFPVDYTCGTDHNKMTAVEVAEKITGRTVTSGSYNTGENGLHQLKVNSLSQTLICIRILILIL